MTPAPARLGVSVGITNTRMSAAKRGIAVELALRLVAATGAPVCLVGADPTDRDVERRVPELLGESGESTRMQVSNGTRSLDAVFMPSRRLCVVSIPDRVGFEAVWPELQSTFGCIVIDAPSRVGGGIGISRILLERLDMLLVASGLMAGELAEARTYIEQLSAIPRARGVAVRVVTTGHPHDSGLSPKQLERRLRALPVVGRIPSLWGREHDQAPGYEGLDDAFRPVVDAIIMLATERKEPAPALSAPDPRKHIASALYRNESARQTRPVR